MSVSWGRLAKEQFAHRETEELLKLLDSVALKVGSRGQVFDDFLTMTVCALAGGTMEEEYLATIAKYTEGEKGRRPVDQLANGFGVLVRIMEETRADILGDLFQGAITYGERGQFFTPQPICDLMAQLNTDDDPSLGKSVCDPCCGSGRMLLAMAKLKPFARFVGQDSDLRCVKITAINLALHNLYGHVIWGNSLANEQKLIYETGFNGKGVIRMIAAEDVPQLATVVPPLDPQHPPPQDQAPAESKGPLKQGLLFE